MFIMLMTLDVYNVDDENVDHNDGDDKIDYGYSVDATYADDTNADGNNVVDNIADDNNPDDNKVGHNNVHGIMIIILLTPV
eukprot:gene1299-biopygen5781